MKLILKAVFQQVHKHLAPMPKSIVRPYIETISMMSRRLPERWTPRIQSSIAGYALPWSEKEFPARQVLVGDDTLINLTPHLGEFDEWALFSRRLDYEREVFQWLERNAATSYDIVVEIGANVGVYTCFFDALIKSGPTKRLTEIVAFEPSPEAYRRLLNNLAANDATTVRPFNAAIGKASEFISFFEPKGHLTNGSFLKEFSEIFSNDVVERPVISMGTADLSYFLKARQHPLIKMDVEGYEAPLLAGMEHIIEVHRPDFLIEVLDKAPEEIEAIEALRPYRRVLITSTGLELHPRLFTSPTHRDWLLLHPGSLASVE